MWTWMNWQNGQSDVDYILFIQLSHQEMNNSQCNPLSATHKCRRCFSWDARLSKNDQVDTKDSSKKYLVNYIQVFG